MEVDPNGVHDKQGGLSTLAVRPVTDVHGSKNQIQLKDWKKYRKADSD